MTARKLSVAFIYRLKNYIEWNMQKINILTEFLFWKIFN